MCNGLAYASTCSSAFSTMAAMFRMTVVLHRGSRNANPTYIWQSQSVCVQLFDCRGEASVSAPRPDTSAGRYLHRMTSGKSGAHDADDAEVIRMAATALAGVTVVAAEALS